MTYNNVTKKRKVLCVVKNLLACPICGEALCEKERIYRCTHGHSFDRSSYGYVNLLLAKDSRGHGDNKEMIMARNRFLSGGWYTPLLQSVAKTAISVLPQNGVLLDAGCGEGWYTEGVCQALKTANISFSASGIDISKDALKVAGKRPLAKAGEIEYAVGSVYKMPFVSDEADLIVNLFAPLAPEEYIRCLKKDGYLLLVVPDRFHLWGLKQVLYDVPYENEVADSALNGFTLVSEEAVSAHIRLENPADIQSLFLMTPYAFRTGEAGRARLMALKCLETEIAFRVFLYKAQK